LSRAPEIFPVLIARKTIVLFNPVAAAAAAIVKALAPHFHDVFEGEDPTDDPELIHYAIDLIHDTGRPFGTFIDDDPIATAIHNVYRGGAEDALGHVERAVEWHAAFEAHRRTLVERRQAEFVTVEQQRLGIEFPEDRFDGILSPNLLSARG